MHYVLGLAIPLYCLGAQGHCVHHVLIEVLEEGVRDCVEVKRVTIFKLGEGHHLNRWISNIYALVVVQGIEPELELPLIIVLKQRIEHSDERAGIVRFVKPYLYFLVAGRFVIRFLYHRFEVPEHIMEILLKVHSLLQPDYLQVVLLGHFHRLRIEVGHAQSLVLVHF